MISTEAKEQTALTFAWYYLDEENQFDRLIESCNIKGIRERRLQENLRKIRERMKLKKGRKPKEVSQTTPTTGITAKSSESAP